MRLLSPGIPIRSTKQDRLGRNLVDDVAVTQAQRRKRKAPQQLD